MTYYADLEVSVIDELPPGRTPIKTVVVGEEKRAGVYKGIEREVRAGRQAYVVYPLVEESEKMDLKDATRMFEHLRDRVFPKMGLKLEDDSRLLCDPNNVRVGSVHLAVDMLTPVPPPEPAEADQAGAAAGQTPKDATPPAPVAASAAADSTAPAPTAAAPAIEQKPATDDPMPVEVDPKTEAKLPDADPKPVQSPSDTPPD
jgi:hypothetical protein